MPRNGFTPDGNYPKIQLPWTELEVPWVRPETHGRVDIDKLEANFAKIKAQVDDQSRYLNRTTFNQGEGTRWATIVIAASDSTDLSKSTADYVCGVSDAGTVISNAITRLEARAGTTSLGRIVLLEGTYALGSGSISMNNLGGRAIHIQGMGGGTGNTSTRGATYISSTAAVFSVAGSSSSGGSSLQISDCHIVGSGSSACITATDTPLRIERCTIVASGSGGAVSQTNTTGSSGITFVNDCIVHSSASGANGINVDVGSGSDEPIFVRGNRIQTNGGSGVACGNNISTIPSYIVADNFIRGSATGIELKGNSIENCTVTGNVVKSCTTGISCAGYKHTVSGNIVENCTTGIRTSSDSQYLGMLANNVAGCTTAFVMADNAVRPTVIGNKASACTNAYSIAAGVTNAFVGYNDFGGATGTDAGTSTTIVQDLPTGGATNYVLKKNSATTGDYGWALDPAIDAIAGKGSLLVGTAIDALQSLGVGLDQALLTPDSAQVVGVKWGRRLFVQDTDPALTISPTIGDVWIDTT